MQELKPCPFCDRIFPIEEHESEILHQLGWSSGYGWRDEWDWWRTALPDDKQMESRDWESTKELLLRHITILRRARKEADFVVRVHFAHPDINKLDSAWNTRIIDERGE